MSELSPLYRARRERKETQKFVAGLLGVSQAQISRYEGGQDIPQDRREVLARHYDKDPDYFIDDEKEEKVLYALSVLGALPSPEFEQRLAGLLSSRSQGTEEND